MSVFDIEIFYTNLLLERIKFMMLFTFFIGLIGFIFLGFIIGTLFYLIPIFIEIISIGFVPVLIFITVCIVLGLLVNYWKIILMIFLTVTFIFVIFIAAYIQKAELKCKNRNRGNL